MAKVVMTLNEKPVRKAPTLAQYLKKMNNGNIRMDASVQRLAGQWDKEAEAFLIATVLTNDYMPAIILGEVAIDGSEDLFDTYLLDGLQRSTTLQNFRFGNVKVTKDIDIPYRKLVIDEDGNRSMSVEYFNLKNKTFDMLPEELKDIFDEYQIETETYENCTPEKATTTIRTLNRSKSMSTNQKAFTYQGDVAENVREIVNDTFFFSDCGNYTGSAIKNGTVEKIVNESYMAVFDRENWKSKVLDMSVYVNETATKKNFDELERTFSELYEVSVGKFKNFFNSKNTCVFVALYSDFKKANRSVDDFEKFLCDLEGSLSDYEINGVTWNALNAERNTKDKSMVLGKIEFLNTLAREYFGDNKSMAA